MENENVTHIEIDGKDIYLIGTAHVSSQSAEETGRVIDEIRPDSICVELDDDRIESIKDPDKWKNTDIITVIKQKKAMYLLVSLILSSYQKRLAKSFGVSVGGEMLVGINKAQETGAVLTAADRPIRTTFTRIWRKMSGKGKIKLLTGLFSALLDDETISEEEMEQLKQKDILESAMGEMAQQFPELKRYLVDERDAFLAEKIRTSPGKTIVAIVGAAHVHGITEILTSGSPVDINELSSQPEKKPLAKLAGWVIPLLVLIMFAVTYLKDPSSFGTQMLRWVIYNGTFSATAVLLAGGNIISALTAFIAAPITSLNPLLAAGWFAGLVQAKIAPPKVADFESVTDDITTLKGFYGNKLLKVLVVAAAGNIGSTIGTFAAGIGLFSSLFD